ncbi:hypothetical protein BH11ARM2_BH11ARM2_24840 [soil metagenome]
MLLLYDSHSAYPFGDLENTYEAIHDNPIHPGSAGKDRRRVKFNDTGSEQANTIRVKLCFP